MTTEAQMRQQFEKVWQQSLDSYTGNPDANTYGCSHKEAGWLMFQAALSALPRMTRPEIIKLLLADESYSNKADRLIATLPHIIQAAEA